MYSKELQEEVSLWRAIFKRPEMEMKFQAKEIDHRSIAHISSAIVLGIWALAEMLSQIIQQNSNMPIKFYIYFSINAFVSSFYAIMHHFWPKQFNYWHWSFICGYATNLSWSILDVDFQSFDDKKSFSFGVYGATLVYCFIDGGTFFAKTFLTTTISLMFICSDLYSNTGPFLYQDIARMILPLFLTAIKIRHQELMKRSVFIENLKLSDMMSIIKKQIPLPVIIAKFNKKESTMQYFFGNQQAEKQFGIVNQETYEKFMDNCLLINQDSSNNTRTTEVSSFQFPSHQAKDIQENDFNQENQKFIQHKGPNSLRWLIRRKVEVLFRQNTQRPKSKSLAQREVFSPPKVSKFNSKEQSKVNSPSINAKNKQFRSASFNLPKAGLSQRQNFTLEQTPQKKYFHDSSLNNIMVNCQSDPNNLLQRYESLQDNKHTILNKDQQHIDQEILTAPQQIFFPEPFLKKKDSEQIIEDHRQEINVTIDGINQPEYHESLLLDSLNISEFQKQESRQNVQVQERYQFFKQWQIQQNSPNQKQFIDRTAVSFTSLPKHNQKTISSPQYQGMQTKGTSTFNSLSSFEKMNKFAKRQSIVHNHKNTPKCSLSTNTLQLDFQKYQYNNMFQAPKNSQQEQQPLFENHFRYTEKRHMKNIQKKYQDIDCDDNVQVEHSSIKGNSSVPSKYTVRYRLFRTNEIMAVLIVENESYKKKYKHEKIKNKFLSDIRCHQHLLISNSLSQANSLLQNIQSTSTSPMHQFQQPLTELLACLLSMNLLHHTFYLFNKFISKAHQITTSLIPSHISKVNITQLLRSVSQSLCCEVRMQRILFTNEENIFINSNGFLLKLLLFQFLRFFVQNSLPLAAQLVLALNNEEEDGTIVQITENDMTNRKKIEEQFIRISLTLPYHEKLFVLLESKDLFDFSFDSFLRDEFSGEALYKSVWILKTSCKIIGLLGPYTRLNIKKNANDEFMTMSFLIYKDFNIVLNSQPITKNHLSLSSMIFKTEQKHSLPAQTTEQVPFINRVF